jgi:hypothetical protein
MMKWNLIQASHCWIGCRSLDTSSRNSFNHRIFKRGEQARQSQNLLDVMDSGTFQSLHGLDGVSLEPGTTAASHERKVFQE